MTAKDNKKWSGGFEAMPAKIELKGKQTGLSTISKKAKVGVTLAGILVVIAVVMATVANWSPEPTVDPSGGTKTDMDSEAAAGEEKLKWEKRKNLDDKPVDDEFKGISDGSAATSVVGVVAGPTPVGVPLSASVSGVNGVVPQDPRGLGLGQRSLLVPGPTGAGGKMPPASDDLDFEAKGSLSGGASRGTANKEADKGGGDVDWGANTNPAANLLGGNGGDAATKISDVLSKQAALLAGATAGQGQQQAGVQQDDQNKQLQKENFMSKAESGPTNLPEVRRAPASRYMIVAGSVLPMQLGCDINTDLPNQICATVSQDVYDSLTGRCLLVPQGTKALGGINSQVAMGQNRIQTSWTRLDFDDTSSFSLGGMPGNDSGGAAGFDADVNNHYGKVILIAGIASIFSAGLQLSQPQQSTAAGTPSAGQMIAASTGQEISQTGMQMAQRQLQVQPTLTQVRGYPFTITLTSTLVFDRPYRGCRG